MGTRQEGAVVRRCLGCGGLGVWRGWGKREVWVGVEGGVEYKLLTWQPKWSGKKGSKGGWEERWDGSQSSCLRCRRTDGKLSKAVVAIEQGQ